MQQHTKCTLWKALWLLSIVSLLLAWYTHYSGAMIVGLDSMTWFWNALVFAVLSVPIKMDCHACGVCQVMGEK